MATRKYEQRLRAEAAEATRRRILDVVYQRLSHAPTQPVSVEQVARLARVSRSTVYLIFGSRAGLFDAVTYDLWWRRAGFQKVADAAEHPDALQRLRRGIAAGVRVFASHRDVFRALFAMAQLDADGFGASIARIEENRASGLTHLAQLMAEQDLLRSDVTVDEAAHLLWLLASFDSFDQLYTGRNLPVDDVAQVLITTAERSLYREAHDPG